MKKKLIKAIADDVRGHYEFDAHVLRHQYIRCMNNREPLVGSQFDIIESILDDYVMDEEIYDWDENDVEDILDLLLA